MKVFVTKYALTKGIIEVDGEIGEDGYCDCKMNYFFYCFSKKDYSLTKQGAIEQCKEKKIRKLKNLDRQIKKISAIEFN